MFFGCAQFVFGIQVGVTYVDGPDRRLADNDDAC